MHEASLEFGEAPTVLITGRKRLPQHSWHIYTPRKEAAKRIASAKALTIAVLNLKHAGELDESHLRDALNLCLFKLSEAEPEHKYRTRFRSVLAQEIINKDGCDPKQLRHDHVFERADLQRELLAAKDDLEAENILQKVVACTVTKDEHEKKLRSPKGGEIRGWDRYKSRDGENDGVEIVDTKTNRRGIPNAPIGSYHPFVE